ncbi:MAG: fused MFS/spermidine synthase [Chloroflexota bacterium]
MPLLILPVAIASALLFVLELLAGRLVLPAFGGGPAVWTTTLGFFTVVVLLAYTYAHLVATRLPRPLQARVHLVLVAVAAVLAVLAPSPAALRVEGLAPALNVLLAVAVIAGPAAFVLAATTPLVSSWAAADDPARRAPWWLYAVSNAASFAGLLAYPLLLEPLLPLSVQRALVVAGLVAYGIAIVLLVRPSAGTDRAAALLAEPAEPAAASAPEDGSTIPAGTRLLLARLLAAGVPAALMAATTAFLQSDLIAAPLIWIGPLAAYLLSLVVAFADRGARAVRAAHILLPVAVVALLAPWFAPGRWPLAIVLPLEIAGLFCVALSLHGRLHALRPPAAGLTRFYLLVAAGGALGTLLVALAAPVVFDDTLEYPLLLLAAVALTAWLGPAIDGRTPREVLGIVAVRIVAFLVVSDLLVILLSGPTEIGGRIGIWALVAAVCIVLAVRPGLLALGTAIVVAAVLLTAPAAFIRERSFFGVLSVVDVGDANVEFHGTTLHGLQFSDDRFAEPTTYYSRFGPAGSLFDELRARRPQATIGAVGLGVGTLAAYAQAGDRFTFYEIDPAVLAIALDERAFTYLRLPPDPPTVVIDDARIALGREPLASMDLLLLDAFTSDAIPVHLLTREALALYAARMAPDGAIGIHVSSIYYALTPAVAATVRAAGMVPLTQSMAFDVGATDRTGAVDSEWIVAVAPGTEQRFLDRGWQPIPDAGPVLTDDYANLLVLLR